MTATIDEGRPAATVVIVRDRADGAPDILMLERATSIAFVPGALVFPGGALDASDRALVPVETIRPWFDQRDGDLRLCIPTHLGYPVTSEAMIRVQHG